MGRNTQVVFKDTELGSLACVIAVASKRRPDLFKLMSISFLCGQLCPRTFLGYLVRFGCVFAFVVFRGIVRVHWGLAEHMPRSFGKKKKRYADCLVVNDQLFIKT